MRGTSPQHGQCAVLHRNMVIRLLGFTGGEGVAPLHFPSMTSTSAAACGGRLRRSPCNSHNTHTPRNSATTPVRQTLSSRSAPRTSCAHTQMAHADSAHTSSTPQLQPAKIFVLPQCAADVMCPREDGTCRQRAHISEATTPARQTFVLP